ncbi:MAG: Hpt domain-containing protein [Alphaproteobacteria bacterium]|nr:Hpt domain-containing protein [Alphaproteobacteria bacterium]
MKNSDNEPEKTEVEVFERVNRLKIKSGGSEDSPDGVISAEAIEEADQSITEMCTDCPDLVNKSLQNLTSTWAEMKENTSPEKRKELAQKMFTDAHEIKDLSGMCGYTLISEFAESLRDYILETTLTVDAQRIIVQAHIDAIQIVHREDIRDDGGPLAQELKLAVQKAIKQHK